MTLGSGNDGAKEDNERPADSASQHSGCSKASPFIGQRVTKQCARMSARATPEEVTSMEACCELLWDSIATHSIPEQGR